MANLLSTPAHWTDGTNSPPSCWSAMPGAYIRNGGDASPILFWYNGPAVAAGDYLGLEVEGNGYTSGGGDGGLVEIYDGTTGLYITHFSGIGGYVGGNSGPTYAVIPVSVGAVPYISITKVLTDPAGAFVVVFPHDYVAPIVVLTNDIALTAPYNPTGGTPASASVTPTVTEDSTPVTPDSLTILSSPTHGTAVVTAGQLVYTATDAYSGADSFTYKATWDSIDSNTATVTVTVPTPTVLIADEAFTAPYNSPIATPQSASVTPPVTEDSNPVTPDLLVIVTAPIHGTAVVSGVMLVYTAATGYAGTDTFTYQATWESIPSNVGTATVTITAPVLVDACTELGRVTRVYTSAYTRDRVHASNLVRGEHRCLTANFNGAFDPSRLIVGTNWYCSQPWQISMSNARIITAGQFPYREIAVDITAVLNGFCVIKAVATLDNGEAYTQLFRLNVRVSPWFQGETIPGSGPYVLTSP